MASAGILWTACADFYRLTSSALYLVSCACHGRETYSTYDRTEGGTMRSHGAQCSKCIWIRSMDISANWKPASPHCRTNRIPVRRYLFTAQPRPETTRDSRGRCPHRARQRRAPLKVHVHGALNRPGGAVAGEMAEPLQGSSACIQHIQIAGRIRFDVGRAIEASRFVINKG